MDTTKEYYQLYLRTFWHLASSIGWKEYIIALFCLIFGSTYYVVTKGWNAMVDQAINFIAYTAAPLIFVALVFVLSKLIQTPVKIHNDLKAELEKTSWEGVKVEAWEFSPESGLGIGLHVYNGKSIMLNGAYVIINYGFKGREGWFDEHGPQLFMPWVVKEHDFLYQQMDIYSGQHCYLAVANWDGNRAYLEVMTDEHNPRERFLLEVGIDHYVKFTIYAMLNGFNLAPYITYKAILHYDGTRVTLRPYLEGYKA